MYQLIMLVSLAMLTRKRIHRRVDWDNDQQEGESNKRSSCHHTCCAARMRMTANLMNELTGKFLLGKSSYDEPWNFLILV